MTAAKRAFDLACCLLAAPVAVPLAALIAVLVRVTSGAPVLHRGRRLGRGGAPFEILKFRTMRVTDGAGPGVTAADDPRITPVGRWLRRTKLDELPQLVNVARGEMSIVGPRPEDPRFADQYGGRFAEILSVRPGITGPAAVQFRHEEALLRSIAPADVEAVYVADVLPAKLELDLAYVRRASLRTDLGILLDTVRAVLRATPEA